VRTKSRLPGPAPSRSARESSRSAQEATTTAVLAALADPMRRRLLDVLATQGEATATRAAEVLPVTRQALVKHLAVLDRAGLVESRREGRDVRYAVRPVALQAAAEWMASLAAEWDTRLAVIRRIAEE
jgi:DNA-binding transcriptional ArsR family regulator